MTQLQQQIIQHQAEVAFAALSTVFKATPAEERQALLEYIYNQIVKRVFDDEQQQSQH